jgi:cytochrome P450
VLGPREPPGPPGGRFVGNLADFEADRLGFLLRARDGYGGLVRFDGRTTIVNDPAFARQVLLDRADHFTVLHDFLQQRLTPEDLAETRALRRVVNPLLRPLSVRGLTSLTSSAVRDTLAEHGARGTGAVDPVPCMERVIASAVAEYYFGHEGAALPGAVGELLDALARIVGNPFALPPNSVSPAGRRVRRHHARLLALVRPLVEQRREQPWAYSDLVTRIVTSAPATSTARLTHWIVASLLAGHRVPAAAASWLLMLVADRPALQGQLEVEATQFMRDIALGRPPPNDESPLATSVVLETLRLYPTTWLVSRTATTGVSLGAYEFGAGHHFLVSPYVLQRDPVEWPRAPEFRPERWLERPRPSGIFVPFGLGIHACPGRDPAMLMLVAILLTVVHHWTLSRTAAVVREDPRTTLLPQGLRISFGPRAAGCPANAQPLAG